MFTMISVLVISGDDNQRWCLVASKDHRALYLSLSIEGHRLKADLSGAVMLGTRA